MRHDRLLLLVTLALGFASCSVTELYPDTENPVKARTLNTRSATSGFADADSLRLIYEHQTSQDALMLRLLVKEDETYRIKIPQELAIKIGVDAETYSEYVNFVEALNRDKGQ